MATPKVFLCPSDAKKSALEDDYQKYDPGTGNLYNPVQIGTEKDFSDFQLVIASGVTLIGYSFHVPYSTGWKSSAKPGFIIGGDENNGLDPIDPNKDPKNMNSKNHNSEGQNLLAVDASSIWQNTAYAGIGGDNVYTTNREQSAANLQTTAKSASDHTNGDPGFKGLTPMAPSLGDSVLVPNSQNVISAFGTTPSRLYGNFE
jgi:hypothetical protein